MELITDSRGGRYIPTNDGYKYIDSSGRESFYHRSLVFTRSSGSSYIRVGITSEGIVTIKSMATGKLKEITIEKLRDFAK